MDRGKIRARIVDNLLEAIQKSMVENGWGDEGHSGDEEFLKLAERIQGTVVDMTFSSGDAFEAIDNNYWLPDDCWVEVTNVIHVDFKAKREQEETLAKIKAANFNANMGFDFNPLEALDKLIKATKGNKGADDE